MDQYLLIPFLVGWTSIYQLFWGSLGTRVLTHPHMDIVKKDMSNALSSLPCSLPNLEYPAVDQPESQFHYRGVDQFLSTYFRLATFVAPKIGNLLFYPILWLFNLLTHG